MKLTNYFLVIIPVTFKSNLSSESIFFENLKEYEYHVYGQIKIELKSFKRSFYVEYSPLNVKSTNTICKLLGFDHLHSLNHLDLLDKAEGKVVYMDDWLSPFIIL